MISYIMYIFIASIIFSINLYAIDIPTKSYKEWVITSDKLVKGKIQHRTPVTINKNGKVITCGWLLKINVIQSWKGGDKDFIIFTRHSDVFLGSKLNYIIIANKNTNYGKKIEQKLVGCNDKGDDRDYDKTLVTDISSYEYLAVNIEQMIFPLDPYSSKKYGGEWMIMLNRIVYPYISPCVELRVIDTKHYNFQKEYEVINLLDFINEVIK